MRRRFARLALGLVLVLESALTGCGRSGRDVAPAGQAVQDTVEVNRLLSTLPPPYQHADLDNGRLHVNLCRSCHTIVQGGVDMTGPNLFGVFGRKVGSRPGYAYSSALRAGNWIWDAPHLDGWLKDPKAYAPGTKMGFYGLRDDKDRLDTIAYLRIVSGGGPM